MEYIIKSSRNEKYKCIKSLKQKKARTELNLFTVEGIKSVNDVIGSSYEIESIIVSETFYEKELFDYPNGVDLYIIADEIFAGLSDTENPQGIIAVIKMKKQNNILPDLKKAYIYCDRVQDPGNMGTIIRTADAAGFGGVFLSPGCVDLYNPKTVRSSMGSFFHIEKYENVTVEELKKFKTTGFTFMCATLSEKTICYTDADFTVPAIIAIGNEANGICEAVLSVSDTDIKIPIDGGAESLNAAVAAAVIMYEVNRQRKLIKG